MQYSEEFKRKVLDVFGNSEEMKKLLESGSQVIGRILDDARQSVISAKEIVSACESMNVQGLYQKAKRQLVVMELYGEWLEIFRKQSDVQKQEEKLITMENVVKALKFIAENQEMSQEELRKALLKLGCDFTLDDIKKQFPEDIMLFEGMNKGNLSCGASVVVNMRDSEYGKSYGEDRFLSIDDDTSIYHFIRLVTGDETYTKEYVDSLIDTDKKRK